MDNDDIVISGVAGYFPKAENMEKLKELLFSGEDFFGSRWKEGDGGTTSKIGVCPDISHFDTLFFSIHKQQATFMDPMGRLLLERSFEAVIDAGMHPADIRGKKVACFTGSSIGETDNLIYESILTGFGITGNSRAMHPNRISYSLNLKGPSCSYDANWISGLEVLKLAYAAIKEGHCESAIIGTANLAINSEVSWIYKDENLLSPDGTTRAFDAEANGYGRSDGIVTMFIQRASDAKRSYATIVNVDTIYNGLREGPAMDLDQSSLTDFMKKFYKDCKIKPEDVDFVECYGCGLKRYDEAELNSIDEVFCKKRKTPLMIGSIKTVMGHSEPSSSLFGIIKALIAMETGIIPATLNYSKPNPKIPGLVEGRLEVVTDDRKWNGEYIAVNGIGLTSEYGHCLLKRNAKNKDGLAKDKFPRILCASTRTEVGINTTLDKIKDQPKYDVEYLTLIQNLYSKDISGHLYRGYSILGADGEITRNSEHFHGNKRQTWFVYSGMGSQWVKMGKELMTIPIFAETIQKCHSILAPHNVDLIKIITEDDPKLFDNILNSFVGIAAIQIALTDILTAMGVTPDGIIGHSVGELGCAYADGCLTAEQMILAAYYRGKASIEATLINGMMAAIGLSYNQIKDKLPPSIEVACHNSKNSCTISGPTEDMEKLVAELKAQGVFARLVNVANIAYHSQYIKPAAPLLLKYLKEIMPKAVARSSKWISTSVPEAKWDSNLAKHSSAEYHTNNLLSSVLFEEGSSHIPRDSIVIEIAPHGLLQAILKKSMKSGCTNIALTQRTCEDPIVFLLTAIGKMYLAGISVNPSVLYQRIEFPVSRGTCGLAPLVDWDHGEEWRTGLEDKLNHLNMVKEIQIDLNTEEFKYCGNHELDRRIIFSLSSFLEFLIKIFATRNGIEVNNVTFENVRFRNVLKIPKFGCVLCFGTIPRGSGEFSIVSGNEIIATGVMHTPHSDDFFQKTYEIESEPMHRINSEDFYKEFAHRGHNYQGRFSGVEQISIHKEGSIVKMRPNCSWHTYVEGALQQMLLHHSEKYQEVSYPLVIERINLSLNNIPRNEDVTLKYHYATGIVHTSGLQISKITFAKLPKVPPAMSFKSLDLITLDNFPCENIEKIINYSVNLTLMNFTRLQTNFIQITEITSSRSLIKSIRSVMETYSQLQANLSECTEIKSTMISKTDPVLIVSDHEISQDLVKLFETTNAFALVRSSKNILATHITTVASFVLRGLHYSLIRRCDAGKVKIVKFEGEILTCNESHDWMKKVKGVVKNAKNEVIFFVSHVLPKEGISNFLKYTQNNFDFKLVKYLFVLDPKQNLNDNFYENIFARKNLATIVKNGIASTYVSCSIEFYDNVRNDVSSIGSFVPSHQKSDDTLAYIGINSNNETLDAKNVDVGNLDYSAVTKDKNHIMGLASFDKDTNTINMDPILKWDVPKSWSLEDACTVPHAYITAYYTLIQKARLKPGNSILIHSGCSAIGLASISIAYDLGCIVYTSIVTDFQRNFLKKQFPKLNDNYILNSKDVSFEQQLLNLTNGNGVTVVINTLTDSLMEAGWRCLSDYGKFMQLGKLDPKINNTLTMSVFLKNVYVHGVVPENILTATQEDKENLKQLLQTGINRNIVRPIHRKILESQALEQLVSEVTKPNHIGKILLNVNNIKPNQNQFICNVNSTYLISGGNPEQWIDAVEWLVFRGARKIFVYSDGETTTNIRRLALLQSHFNADIKFCEKTTAAQIISIMHRKGEVRAAFILPTENGEVYGKQVEMALRTIAPIAVLINFSSESLCDNGFSYNVQWDDSLQFIDVLSALENILQFRVNNIILKDDQVSEFDVEVQHNIHKRSLLLLPSCTEDILQQADVAIDVPTLIKLPTFGPRSTRNSIPVFVIPGLTGNKIIADFAMNIMQPVYYAQMPSQFISIKDASRIIAMKIAELYPSGPYNIIGVSCGGIMTIEIGKLLEKMADTQIFLLDGAPGTITSALKYLADDVNGEIITLTRSLDISTENLRDLSGLPNWNSRLSTAVDLLDISDQDKTVIKESLKLLKQNMEALKDFVPVDLFEGKTYLIRPTGSNKNDNCGLNKYIKQFPEVVVSTGDHLSILKSETTLDFINKHILVYI